MLGLEVIFRDYHLSSLDLELPRCWSWSGVEVGRGFLGMRGLGVLLALARCGRGAGVGAVLGLEVVFGVTAYPFFDIGVAVVLVELERCLSRKGFLKNTAYRFWQLDLSCCWSWHGVVVVLELERLWVYKSDFSGIPPIGFRHWSCCGVAVGTVLKT